MSKVLPILFALLVQHKPAPQQEKAPAPQIFKFGDDWVSITPVKPDDGVVEITRRHPPGNLHLLRKHFVPELYKSAENVN